VEVFVGDDVGVLVGVIVGVYVGVIVGVGGMNKEYSSSISSISNVISENAVLSQILNLSSTFVFPASSSRAHIVLKSNRS